MVLFESTCIGDCNLPLAEKGNKMDGRVASFMKFCVKLNTMLEAVIGTVSHLMCFGSIRHILGPEWNPPFSEGCMLDPLLFFGGSEKVKLTLIICKTAVTHWVNSKYFCP